MRSVGRVAIVPVAQIVRLEAADNYVRLDPPEGVQLTLFTVL